MCNTSYCDNVHENVIAAKYSKNDQNILQYFQINFMPFIGLQTFNVNLF